MSLKCFDILRTKTPRDAVKSYTTKFLEHVALVLHLIDLLLDKLKGRKENRVHDT